MARERIAKRRRGNLLVPRHLRLPNPPPFFVGRAWEQTWLASAIKRGPVVAVSGPGGVGKTALIRQVLRASFHRKLDITINFTAPPREHPTQAVLQVLRGIVEIEGLGGDVDFRALQRDTAALWDRVIELAETHPFWIVLEDLYQDEISEVDDFLKELASFVQRSRWIVSSRFQPKLPALAGQVLTLGALSEQELLELAYHWAPGASEASLKDAARESGGSPWVLYQSLSGRSTVAAHEPRGLLSAVSAEGLRLVKILSVFIGPIRPDLLERCGPTSTLETLHELRQQGLVEEVSGGLVLHDVVRRRLQAQGSSRHFDDESHRVADLLLGVDDPDSLLETIRLLVILGRMADLEALLQRWGEVLLSKGYAPRLFKTLQGVRVDSINVWHLRCAAELGNPTALAKISAPRTKGGAEQLTWARTLLAEGDIQGVLETVDSVLEVPGEEKTGTDEIKASLLKANALYLLGRYGECSRFLEGLHPAEERKRAEQEVVSILSRMVTGEPLETNIQEVAKRAIEAKAPEVSAPLVEVLLMTGDLQTALQIVSATLSTPQGARVRLLSTRRLILLQAQIDLLQGRLNDARARLDEVRPYCRGASLHLSKLRVCEAELRLLVGEDIVGLYQEIASWRREAGNVDAAAEAELLALEARCEILEGALREVAPREGTSIFLLRSLEWARMLAIRVTGKVPAFDRGDGRTSRKDRQLTILDELSEITASIVEGGQSLNRCARAMNAARRAKRQDLLSLHTEALLLAADAAICDSNDVALGDVAATLLGIGQSTGSDRLTLEGGFYHAVVSHELEPAQLERTASEDGVAPVAARRSQALLGGEPNLDHIDLRVLEAISARCSIPSVQQLREERSSEDAGWSSGWGIDMTRKQIWFHDGRTVDFRGQDLSWSILLTLIANQGIATKEQLILGAWGEQDYHPLRHDAKFHMAIRKLRELLEDVGPEPRKLVTMPDGYQLQSSVRIAGARPDR